MYWQLAFDALKESVALVRDCLWQFVADLIEELLLGGKLFSPLVFVERHDFVEVFLREVETFSVEVCPVRHGAYECLCAAYLTGCTVDDPFEHACVLAKSRPEPLAVVGLAEPVDVEDCWWVLGLGCNVEPVLEVVADVVADEWKHRHGVAADTRLEADGCCGDLGAHNGSDEGSVCKALGLEYKRHGVGTASSEDEGVDGHTVRIGPSFVDAWTL